MRSALATGAIVMALAACTPISQAPTSVEHGESMTSKVQRLEAENQQLRDLVSDEIDKNDRIYTLEAMLNHATAAADKCTAGEYSRIYNPTVKD